MVNNYLLQLLADPQPTKADEKYREGYFRSYLENNGEAALRGDPAVLGKVAGMDPKLAIGFQDNARAQQKFDRESAAARIDEIVRVLGNAKDPMSYARGVEFLRAKGHDVSPEEANFFNRDNIIAQAMSWKDQLAQKRDARDFAYRQGRDQVGDQQWQQQFSANQFNEDRRFGLQQDQFGFQQKRAASDDAYRNRSFDADQTWRGTQADQWQQQFEADQSKPIQIDGVLVDPKTYQPLYTSPGKPERPTDDIAEYNFYAQQAQASGQQPMPFHEYMTSVKKAGASSTTISMGGQTAWDKESAKLFAKRYDDIGKQAATSQEMLGLYDLAEKAMDTGLRTGTFGENELDMRRFGAALGIGDADKLAGGELVRSVQNRMALIMRSPDSGMGMPGAVSDRDIKFLKDAQVGLDRSPEGNRAMLRAYRAMERRKIEIAQMADRYVQQNGRLDQGFNEMVREHAAKNPLFNESIFGGSNDAGPSLDEIDAELRRRGVQ